MNDSLRVLSKKEALKAISEIYFENKLLSPYQSQDYIKNSGLQFNFAHPEKVLKSRLIYYAIFDEKNRPIAVAPLVLETNKVEKLLYIVGANSPAGHLDFVYSPVLTIEQYSMMIEYILQMNHPCRVLFDRVREESLIFKYTKILYPDIEYKKSVCVAISFKDGHEAWFASLSKSIRQNIRTAYNHLVTDGKTYEARIIKEKLSGKVQEQVNWLYAIRASQYRRKPKIYAVPLLITKRMNPVYRTLKTTQNAITALFYIDGELSAFCSGFLSNNSVFIVPRFAYNSDFSRYSPGGLLINETIRDLSNDNRMQINMIDLSRGTEDYKYNYGGQEHYNYRFVITSR